jgi:VanZ family protein
LALNGAAIPLMQRFIGNLWPAMLWLAGIFLLTLLPGSYFPQVTDFWSLFSPDKLIHIVLFAGLGLLLLVGLRKQYPAAAERYIYGIVAGASVLIAILTELLQWYLPIKRDGNVYDTLADMAGILVGFLFFYILQIKIAKK